MVPEHSTILNANDSCLMIYSFGFLPLTSRYPAPHRHSPKAPRAQDSTGFCAHCSGLRTALGPKQASLSKVQIPHYQRPSHVSHLILTDVHTCMDWHYVFDAFCGLIFHSTLKHMFHTSSQFWLVCKVVLGDAQRQFSFALGVVRETRLLRKCLAKSSNMPPASGSANGLFNWAVAGGLLISTWRETTIYQKLDDGWPKSVEEQGLLLLVLIRHYIRTQYIKDVL